MCHFHTLNFVHYEKSFLQIWQARAYKQKHIQEYLSWHLSTMHYAAMSDEYTYYLPLAVFALFRLQHLMGAYTVVIMVIIAAIAPGTASAIVIIFSVLSPLIPASEEHKNVNRSRTTPFISRSCTKITAKNLYGKYVVRHKICNLLNENLAFPSNIEFEFQSIYSCPSVH